jgi:uncharacterized membrane protein YhaH (DUF805 family)
MRRFFVKYATFRGRASRSEFWWWMLTSIVASIVLDQLSRIATGPRSLQDRLDLVLITDPWSAIGVVLQLAVAVPSLAVSWRRLHDVDRSGAWTLFCLVPLAGPIVYVIMTASRPRPEGARFD